MPGRQVTEGDAVGKTGEIPGPRSFGRLPASRPVPPSRHPVPTRCHAARLPADRAPDGETVRLFTRRGYDGRPRSGGPGGTTMIGVQSLDVSSWAFRSKREGNSNG